MTRKTFDFAVLIQNPTDLEVVHYQVKIYQVSVGMNRRVLKIYSYEGVVSTTLERESIIELATYSSVFSELNAGIAKVEEGTADRLVGWLLVWITLMASVMRFRAWITDEVLIQPARFGNGDTGVLDLEYFSDRELRTHFVMCSKWAPVDSAVWEEDALPETGA